MDTQARRAEMHSKLKPCKTVCMHDNSWVFVFKDKQAAESFLDFVNENYPAGSNKRFRLPPTEFMAPFDIPVITSPGRAKLTAAEHEAFIRSSEALEQSGKKEAYQFYEVRLPKQSFTSRKDIDDFQADINALICSSVPADSKPEWMPSIMHAIQKLTQIASRDIRLS